MRALISIIIFAVITLSAAAPAGAALDPFANQSFACPMETPVTIAGESQGDMVNRYFHAVTSETIGGTLFKTGMAIALLMAIVQFGTGQVEKVRDFFLYFLVAGVLVFPLPGAGKSVMLLLADAGDLLFQSIVLKMGGLDPGFAGGGVGTVSAFQSSLSEAIGQERNDLTQFNQQCFNPGAAQYASQNNNAPLTGPNDPNLQSYYSSTVISVDTMPAFYNMGTNGMITCADLKAGITQQLAQQYTYSFGTYAQALTSNNRKLSPQSTQLMQQYASIPPDQLFANAQNQVATTSPNATTASGTPGSFADLISNFTQTGSLDGQVGRSILTSYFRVILIFLGEFFMLIFDYYIYNIVAVIKLFSAMGMAFGILYYMFFRRLDLPLASLGAWMSANALYIVAAIAMNAFYKHAHYDVASGGAALLGFKNSLSDALFSIAILGVMSTSLAALLSWKGVSLAIHTFGIPRMPRLPGGGGGAAAAKK